MTVSEEDKQAVDVICRNVREFSLICYANGFDLSIQRLFSLLFLLSKFSASDENQRIDIVVTQSSVKCNSRKAFGEMDSLIKRFISSIFGGKFQKMVSEN